MSQDKKQSQREWIDQVAADFNDVMLKYRDIADVKIVVERKGYEAFTLEDGVNSKKRRRK